MRGDTAWRARGHAPGMPTGYQRRAATKAKAAPIGRQPRPRQPSMGTQQPRHVHAATKAKARSQGHGMLAWAWWHAPGHRQQGLWGHAAKALAYRVPEGQWQHGEGVACP